MKTTLCFAILMYVIGAATAEAGNKQPIVVTNVLSDCFTLDLSETESYGNLMLGHFALTRKATTAECGCKSKEVRYRVDGMSNENTEKHVVTAQIVDSSRRHLALLLDPDISGGKHEKYRIYVECMPPD